LQNSQYSKFDDIGVPTHNDKGVEFKKEEKNKLKKEFEKHQKNHEKWLKEQEEKGQNK
jgi:cysteinyl-tRNA synthetase